jgi:hypothetical protein
MIDQRDGVAPDAKLSPKAVMTASGQIGLLHAWLSGECVATPDEMAMTLANRGH